MGEEAPLSGPPPARDHIGWLAAGRPRTSAGPDGSIGQLGGTVLFEVGPGTHTYRYNCQSVTSAEPPGNVSSVVLTYLFVPD